MGDLLLSSPLMLPSPSVLTGTYRPQTAAAFVEQTLAEAKARAGGSSRLASPAVHQSHPKGSIEEVSALRSMASRHLGAIRQSPTSPYQPHHTSLPLRCVSTPPMRPPATAVQQPPAAQTADSPGGSSPATATAATAAAAVVGSGSGTSAHGGSSRPATAAAAGTAGAAIKDLAPTATAVAAGGGGPSAPQSRASLVLHSRPLAMALSVPDPLPSTSGAAVMTEPVLGSPSGSSAHPLFTAHHQLHVLPPAATSPLSRPASHSATPRQQPQPQGHGQPALPRLIVPSPMEESNPAAWGTPGVAPGGCDVASPPSGVGGGSATAAASPRSRSASALAPGGSSDPRDASSQHPHLAPQPHPHHHHHHPVVRFSSLASSGSRPATSLSVQDLTLPKPTAKLPSRSPSRSAGPTQILDCSRSLSGGGGTLVRTSGSSGLATPVLRQGSPAAAGGPWVGGSAGGAQDSPGAASSSGGGGAPNTPSRGGTRFQHTATRWAMDSAGYGPEGARPADGFKVTRGMQYSVFQELDEFDSGRLTYSAFEQAACKVGMRPAQAKRLFEQYSYCKSLPREAPCGSCRAQASHGRCIETRADNESRAAAAAFPRAAVYAGRRQKCQDLCVRRQYGVCRQWTACVYLIRLVCCVRPPRARRRLDPQGRGFTTMREWISPNLQRQMEAFTRLYVLATRERDGKPKEFTEIRSMHMAIQMALVKLQLKRCGRAVSLDRVVQAFSYMDRDSNGVLSSDEVEDALNSLGIFVTKEVIDTIMRTFDKDGSGGVDYYEFVKSLYPTLDQTVYQH